MSQEVNELGGEKARGRISQGGETAKGRKSQTPKDSIDPSVQFNEFYFRYEAS